MIPFKEFVRRTHKCSVPGCHGRDSVRIARTGGAQRALFLCRDCVAQVFAQSLAVDTADCGSIEEVARAVGKAGRKGGTNGRKQHSDL